ncbi:MAG: DUF2274 domain-containing protein [Sphingorhabdus sp.]
MTRLKLSDLADEKPVELTVEINARLHRDPAAYAIAVNGDEAKGAPTPERLIPAMIERFIANNRSFAKSRKASRSP